MIKLRYILILNLLLFTSSVYSKTEVLAPNGPFKSNLRQTFKSDEALAVIRSDNGEKSLEFKVPDLGRYQEGKAFVDPNNSLKQPMPQFHNRPFVNKAYIGSDINKDHNESPAKFLNAFENAVINGQMIESDPFKNAPSPTSPKMTFDSMPIGQINMQDSASYPPEWGFTKPLGNNTNSNFNAMNSRQFDPRSFSQQHSRNGMPFSPPMTQWQMNDNSNVEHR